MRKLLNFFESRIALPEDSKDDSVRKASFLLMTFYTTIPAIIWALVCLFLGLIWAFFIPLLYIVIIGAMCVPIFFTRKLSSLCIYVQFSFLLLLPIIMQISLGGMRKSGILMLWGILAPLGAAIFGSLRGSTILLFIYMILGTCAAAFDYKFRSFAPMLPPTNRPFFIFNFIFLSFSLYRIISYNVHKIKIQRKELEAERNQVSALLNNILPAKTVLELLENGSTRPNRFQNVTVMFTDFQGFTHVSSRLSPALLIDELNDIYTAFDNIIEKYSCERIKTIGDAYLAVCGMPETDPHHAENILNSAIEFIDYIVERNNRTSEKNEVPPWDLRIGIHTGEVIGGVVGVKKYIYDIFGHTVNTASRMETLSEPGKINVSETTWALLREKFRFEKRPLVEVKGLGYMQTFFVVK